MANLRRYTTPVYTLHIPGADLTECDVLVTLAQGGVVQDHTPVEVNYNSTINESTVVFALTQEESSAFEGTKSVKCQVNWLDGSARYATNIVDVDLKENLHEEVMS